MRIDSHQHFWRYSPARHQWITDEMGVLKRDFLPEQLAPELAVNEMQGCIAVQTDQSEEETLFLLDLAARHSQIQGVVGWVDLCADDIGERLEFFSKYPKLCGFRHIVQSEADDRFMLRPTFHRGIASLAESGYSYDILVYSKQLPAAVELVAKFPEQRFVLDHIAKPHIKDRRLLPWAQHIRVLAENSNVCCKLSGLVTEADWKHWRPDDFKPYLDVIFEAFGVDRLMFGSDWPVCLLAGTYRQILEIIQSYTADLAAMEKDRIFGLNAMQFYGQRTARHAIATRE